MPRAKGSLWRWCSVELESNFGCMPLGRKVCGAYVSVMCCGVMFCELVGSVELALSPNDPKLFLFDAISYPVEAHVNCLGSALFSRVVGDA